MCRAVGATQSCLIDDGAITKFYGVVYCLWRRTYLRLLLGYRMCIVLWFRSVALTRALLVGPCVVGYPCGKMLALAKAL